MNIVIFEMHRPYFYILELTLIQLAGKVSVELTKEVKETIGSQPLLAIFLSNQAPKSIEPIAVIVLQMFDMISAKKLKL